MSKSKAFFLPLILALCACTIAFAQAPTRALIGGTLIDGFGGKPVHNSVILLRGERIEKIGTVETLPVPAAYEHVSTEGMTVMPGIWDMHVHLLYGGHPNGGEWQRNFHAQYGQIMPATANQLLMSGVTTTRDMGAPLTMILGMKKRIASGAITGPTLYAAGPQVAHDSPEGQTFRLAVSGVADAHAKIKELAAAGVDLIKVTDQETLSAEEMSAIVEEAHAHNLRVAAHARSLGEVRRGLAAGVDEFEHINLQDPEYPADIMTALRARTASKVLYWTPTVSLPLRMEYLRDNPEMVDDPATVAGFPSDIVDAMRKAILKWEPKPVPMAREITLRKIAQLRDAGVEFIFGTDAGQIGNSHSHAMWQEMDSWVHDLGMDPLLVIRRATIASAIFMGADKDSGSISEGKFADIIAVQGDPLRNMDVLRNPVLVMKRGRRYK